MLRTTPTSPTSSTASAASRTATGVARTPLPPPAAGELRLYVTVTEGHGVVAVAGEIDAATVPPLAACLRALARRGPITIIVDLHDVSFLDAAGLRAFVTARKQLRRQGGNLIVASPSKQARLVLDVTGLDALLAQPRPEQERS